MAVFDLGLAVEKSSVSLLRTGDNVQWQRPKDRDSCRSVRGATPAQREQLIRTISTSPEVANN
jgi:hypothetical protein